MSQVPGDGSKNKLIMGAPRATQSKPTEPPHAFWMYKPHLNLPAITPRLLEAIGAGEWPCNVLVLMPE